MKCYVCRLPVNPIEAMKTCVEVGAADLIEQLNLVHCEGPNEVFHDCRCEESILPSPYTGNLIEFSGYQGVTNVCRACLEAAITGGEDAVNARVEEVRK